MVVESYERESQDREKLFAIRTMLTHLCAACGVSDIEEIRSDRFWDIERTMQKHLVSPGVKLSKKTQREYRHRLRILMKYARAKGYYTQIEPNISPEWKAVAEEANEKIHHVACWGIMKLGKFAAQCGYEPGDCDKKFFESYYQYLCSAEGGVAQPRISYNRSKLAMQQLFPNDFPDERFYALGSKNNESYRLPWNEWNEEMQRDIQLYSKWCTALYMKGRPKKCKQKEETNKNNVTRLERYVGYLHRIYGIPIADIDWDAILYPDNVVSFIEYLDRVNQPNGVYQKGYLQLFLNLAINFLPCGLSRTCPYVDELNEIFSAYIDIPRFRPEDFADRYEEVKAIADEIWKKRVRYEAINLKAGTESDNGIGLKTIASMYMKELLVRLAIFRPFRSQNFRGMCLDTNLIEKNGKFVIRFENEAIKTGKYIKYVEFPFPEALLPLLKEYVEKQRPILQGDTKFKNLFLSRAGTPLIKHQIRKIFLDWSMKVHGKHLTTHHIRHIAATGYLKRHPGDFLTLQKMLMHRRLETTIRVYSQFNETHASKHFDEFSVSIDNEMYLKDVTKKRRVNNTATRPAHPVLRVNDNFNGKEVH